MSIHIRPTLGNTRERRFGMKSSEMSQSAGVLVLRDARIATLREGALGLGVIERGAIALNEERIAYVGPESDLPAALRDSAEVVDCEGRWITPGLVDCHTHLIFAGDRAEEFELRHKGASYEEIARAGGGIVSSVRALRAASEDELVKQALPRLDALIAEGVTTIEIKSGYGLDLANERKTLRAAARLGDERNVRITKTFLGAHATPPEAKGEKDAYIAEVSNHMLPALARDGLIDAVDGFCEGIAFSPAQIDRVFEAALALKLPVKLHADQLSNLHGAALAAKFGALSADHLEYTDEDGALALSLAGTVAVMLPGAYYFLREAKAPPIELFRKCGVKLALATDCNPGTSPMTSLLMTMNMGATLFRMTVDECLAGVTREAARALGLLGQTGTLEVGKAADLAIWEIERPAELVYRIGFNPLWRRVREGR
jgi:imidazolonepropionase